MSESGWWTHVHAESTSVVEYGLVPPLFAWLSFVDPQEATVSDPRLPPEMDEYMRGAGWGEHHDQWHYE